MKKFIQYFFKKRQGSLGILSYLIRHIQLILQAYITYSLGIYSPFFRHIQLLLQVYTTISLGIYSYFFRYIQLLLQIYTATSLGIHSYFFRHIYLLLQAYITTSLGIYSYFFRYIQLFLQTYISTSLGIYRVVIIMGRNGIPIGIPLSLRRWGVGGGGYPLSQKPLIFELKRIYSFSPNSIYQNRVVKSL